VKQEAVEQQQQQGNEWRPPTPPRDQQANSNEEEGGERRRESEDAIMYNSPPLSDNTATPSPKLSTNEGPEAIIKGYETWTMEDDKILMAHVLTRLSGCRWKEAELKLRGRHSATVCENRWQVLRDLLIRSADKSGTQGW
jgi:hypothetical protein